MVDTLEESSPPVIDLQPKKDPYLRRAIAPIILITLLVAVVVFFTIYSRGDVVVRSDVAPAASAAPAGNASSSPGATAPAAVKSNFFAYVHQADAYVDRNVTLYGFLVQLSESSVGDPTYRSYVVDDDGRKVQLSDVPTDLQRTIPKDTATLEMYQVNGSMRKSYSTYSLAVTSVVRSERPTLTP